jgi:hypothetical protein
MREKLAQRAAREEDLESVLARLKESKYLRDLWEPRLGNLVQRRTSGGDGQDCQVEWGAANDQTTSQCMCRKDHISGQSLPIFRVNRVCGLPKGFW